MRGGVKGKCQSQAPFGVLGWSILTNSCDIDITLTLNRVWPQSSFIRVTLNLFRGICITDSICIPIHTFTHVLWMGIFIYYLWRNVIEENKKYSYSYSGNKGKKTYMLQHLLVGYKNRGIYDIDFSCNNSIL